MCISLMNRMRTDLTFDCDSTVRTNRLTDCVSLCVLEMSVLKCKDYAKFLGMLIDKNSTWRLHINHIAWEISKIVGDTQTRKIIYFFGRRWVHENQCSHNNLKSYFVYFF